MRLAPGNSVGPYKILGTLGAGGMGEVYRAEHVRLGREVAVKVLRAIGADDPIHRERFEREARILASLNHPNIAMLHGVEDCHEGTLLEMELVPGETLAERIAHGPMPSAEALPIFKQIAQALEAAHERGIIHRDLKPSNVKITPDGQVKVLDFGLAKPYEQGSVTSSPEARMFTTTTEGGLLLGTAAYMSPEQIRGKPLDRRADIWAFGCMLYETLSGKSPFSAETMSDTLASVLRSEPDWHALPALPAALQRLIHRCLRKDPQERLRDIADARLEIEEAAGETVVLRVPPSALTSPARVSPKYLPMALWLAMGVAMIALVVWLTRFGASAPARVARLLIPVKTEHHLDRSGPLPLAVSPDGSRVVYAALQRGGRTQLFVRPLDRFDSTPLPSTEGASSPVFSPDGKWVGFYAEGALQKVSLDGGAALRISESPPVWNATWAPDDTIVFATAASPNGLWRVPVAGGTPERLTTADVQHGEVQHAYPEMLPNGDVLFAIMTRDHGWRLAVLSMSTRKWHTLGQQGGGAPAVYVAPGYIVYAQAGGLVSIPFDFRHESLGSPIPLLEQVSIDPSGTATFAVSPSGTLVYSSRPDALPSRSLITADRDGRVSYLSSGPASYAHPRFSRDGTRLAVTIESANGSDIWIHDLRRNTRTRLTGGGVNRYPVWSPDGRSITFQATSAGRSSLYIVPSDGSSEPRPLLSPAGSQSPSLSQSLAGVLPGTAPIFFAENPQIPLSWSPDGRHLAFASRKPSGDNDIWIVDENGVPASFLLTPFDEQAAAFSPDGVWLAYVSDESGRNEVYVQPYPGPGGKWPISSDGGTEPAWSPDGRELFYRHGDQLFAVSVQTSPEFQVGQPHPLFQARYETVDGSRNYDVAADGRSFVMVRSEEGATPDAFRIVLNWASDLTKRR